MKILGDIGQPLGMSILATWVYVFFSYIHK